MSLSHAVISELNRLGAYLGDNSRNRDILLEETTLPGAIEEFLSEVVWPDDNVYGFRPQIDVDQDSDDFDWEYHEQCMIMHHVDFAYEPLEFLTMAQIGDIAENRDLMMIGIADGGNYRLTVSLDDDNPSDPTVIVFEHDVYAEEDFLPETFTLSELLAKLIDQEDVNHLEEQFDVHY